jgi:hypothetical protein
MVDSSFLQFRPGKFAEPRANTHRGTAIFVPAMWSRIHPGKQSPNRMNEKERKINFFVFTEIAADRPRGNTRKSEWRGRWRQKVEEQEKSTERRRQRKNQSIFHFRSAAGQCRRGAATADSALGWAAFGAVGRRGHLVSSSSFQSATHAPKWAWTLPRQQPTVAQWPWPATCWPL